MIGLRSLIGRLPRFFSRSAEAVAVATVSKAGTTLVIKGGFCAIRDVAGETLVALDGLTVATFLDALASEGITISGEMAEQQSLSAMGLKEDSYDIGTEITIKYPTSGLWSELAPIGKELALQRDAMANAERQLYMDTAEGDWLSFWAKDIYGTHRNSGETDADLFARAVAEITKITQNNVAIEIILIEAFSLLDCTITDTVDDPDPQDSVVYDGTYTYDGERNYTGNTANEARPFFFSIKLRVPAEHPLSYEELGARVLDTVKKIKSSGTYPINLKIFPSIDYWSTEDGADEIITEDGHDLMLIAED